jgi:hypothetical protein
MTFSPPRSSISAITQANPCVVTTSTNHKMTTGQVARLHVPVNYGMVPLNNKTYSITVLSPTTFSLQITQVPVAINVDSRLFPAFMVPSNPQFTAEALPIGAGPTPVTNTTWQMTNKICQDLTDDAMQNIATTNQPF